VLGRRRVPPAVVEQQGALLPCDQRLHRLPERRRVRRLSRQPASEGIVSGRRGLLGLAGSGFGAGEHALGGDEKLNVVKLVNLWGIHGEGMYPIHAPLVPTA